MKPTAPIKILYLDDDDDDHFIFSRVLSDIDASIQLVSLRESEKLMDYLLKNLDDLPHYIFLDLNMPKKNGKECVTEIKANSYLNHIPVIIYSTSYGEDILDELYQKGAIFAIRKSSSCEQIKKMVRYVLESNNLTQDKNRFALEFK
jgi:response regulator RpfG family c-di-GMP phosphodiesterase